jgi:hypothetical protein
MNQNYIQTLINNDRNISKQLVLNDVMVQLTRLLGADYNRQLTVLELVEIAFNKDLSLDDVFKAFSAPRYLPKTEDWVNNIPNKLPNRNYKDMPYQDNPFMDNFKPLNIKCNTIDSIASETTK